MAIGFLLVFVMTVAIVLIKSIVVVPRGKVFVIATLGRPTRVLQAGLNFVTPIVTTVAAKVPVDEQVLDVPDTSGHLRDGTPVTVKGSMRYRVTDPLVAVTNVADYRHALAELARTHWLRELDARDAVSLDPSLAAALPAIRTAAASWGIEAIDARMQTIMSEDGMRELQKQASLERDRRVLEWLAQRQESPGADGRPTTAQHAAYNAWIEQQMAEHREEIEAAAHAAASPAPVRATTPASFTFATAQNGIPAGGSGLVEADGREYMARNQSTVAILAGFRCIVERQEGDTLVVRPL